MASDRMVRPRGGMRPKPAAKKSAKQPKSTAQKKPKVDWYAAQWADKINPSRRKTDGSEYVKDNLSGQLMDHFFTLPNKDGSVTKVDPWDWEEQQGLGSASPMGTPGSSSGPSRGGSGSTGGSSGAAEAAALAQLQAQYSQTGADVGALYKALADRINSATPEIDKYYDTAGSSIDAAYKQSIAETQQRTEGTRQAFLQRLNALGQQHNTAPTEANISDNANRLQTLLGAQSRTSQDSLDMIQGGSRDFNRAMGVMASAEGTNRQADLLKALAAQVASLKASSGGGGGGGGGGGSSSRSSGSSSSGSSSSSAPTDAYTKGILGVADLGSQFNGDARGQDLTAMLQSIVTGNRWARGKPVGTKDKPKYGKWGDTDLAQLTEKAITNKYGKNAARARQQALPLAQRFYGRT